MNIDLLVNEIQLKDGLGKSVTENRRADFSLLLAMLSGDVREHSQFHLLTTEHVAETTSNEALRHHFNLPKQSPLSAENPNDLRTFNQCAKVSRSMTDIRLSSVLNPLPLAIHNDAKRISEDVLSNTSLWCQMRVKNNLSTTETLSDTLPLNIPSWLDSVATSQSFVSQNYF